jgi:hypothetical protein
MDDVDDFLDDELEGLNDPNVEHLGPPPTLTGMHSHESMYGEGAVEVPGRASSPLLFAQQAQFKQCQQLRVWRKRNGVPSGLGVIEPTATEEDLVRKFPGAMPVPGEERATFVLRPLDTSGREIGQQITMHIDQEHAALRSYRARMAGGGSVAGVSGGMSAAELEILKQQLAMTERRTLQAEEIARVERQRILDREHELAQERVDIARSATESVAAMSERMLESDQQRHQQVMEQERTRADQAMVSERLRTEQHSKQTSDFFSAQMSQSNSMTAAMLERMRQERESDRMRHDREMKVQEERRRAEEARRRDDERAREKEREDRRERDRREWERKMEREQAEWSRRDKGRETEVVERRRRDEEYRRAQESERQRQHDRQMKEMEIAAQRDREHAERMLTISQQKTEAAKGTDLVGLATSAMTLLKDAGIEPMSLIENLTGGGGGAWLQVVEKLAETAGGVMEKSMEARAEEARSAAAAPNVPPGMTLIPQSLIDDGMAGPPAPPEPLVVGNQTPPPGNDGDAAQTPSDRPVSNLNLKAQKAARVALKQLVVTLRSSQEDTWDTAVAMAIGNEMSIFHYAADVTVKYALEEAGAAPDLTLRIIAKLKESPAVPSGMNYGA